MSDGDQAMEWLRCNHIETESFMDADIEDNGWIITLKHPASKQQASSKGKTKTEAAHGAALILAKKLGWIPLAPAITKPAFIEGLPILETPAPTIVVAAGGCADFKHLLDRVHLEMMACEHWETAAQITIMSAEVGVMEAVLNDLIKNYRSSVKLENQ